MFSSPGLILNANITKTVLPTVVNRHNLKILTVSYMIPRMPKNTVKYLLIIIHSSFQSQRG